MNAYHRIDPLMDEHKSHYTPAQLGAFLKVQLLAGRQSSPGRFRSLAALKAALPPAYARHVDFLVAEGDLIDEESTGMVYVDHWDEWQTGNLSVGERMSLIRRSGPRPAAERTALWRLRRRIFERDSYTCRYCGTTGYPLDWLVLEHLTPGGPNSDENCVTACRPCSKKKGNRTQDEAGMLLRDLDVTRHENVTVTRHAPSQVTRNGVTSDVTCDASTRDGIGIGTSVEKVLTLARSELSSHEALAILKAGEARGFTPRGTDPSWTEGLVSEFRIPTAEEFVAEMEACDAERKAGGHLPIRTYQGYRTRFRMLNDRLRDSGRKPRDAVPVSPPAEPHREDPDDV